MKKFFGLILVLILLAFPAAAQAQTGDSVNLCIQLLDQSAAKDPVTCVSLQSGATGEITQQILDSSFQAAFKDYPVQQFSLSVNNNSGQSVPALSVSLYRGAKTQILHMDQNTAELCVANGAEQLTLALVLDASGHLSLYTITDKAIKAFSSLPASKSEINPNQVGIKFYFQDIWNISGSNLALKMDAGDLHPSNLDGEIFLDAVSIGTHKLIVSSKSGAKLAESHISIARSNETGLTGSNQTNPVISAGASQQVVYVLADAQDNLVKIRQVSAGPLSPGMRPELSTLTLQGCLVDSAQKPVPQMKLSMGDYASTTDASGMFEMDELPLDHYQITAKDASGKKVTAFTLRMEKDIATGIKDVTLNSASVTVGPSASNLYLTLQLTDDRALLLKAASDKQLVLSAPVAAASPVQTAQANTSAPAGNSLLAVYAYLLAAILALVVVVIVVLIRLRRAGKSRH